MHTLFIHPNFPNPFVPIAHYMMQHGGSVSLLTSVDTSGLALPFNHLNYRLGEGPIPRTFRNPENLSGLMDHLMAVYKGLRAMPQLKPDLVVGHMSYGTMLYLRTLYSCPFVGYFEVLPPPFWTEAMNLRKEYPAPEAVRIFNATYHSLTHLHLHNVDGAYTHTHYQRSTAPAELQHKIQVIPEGIDCDFFKPEVHQRPLEFRGISIGNTTKVITYVSPGLESVRGFDLFIQSARIIARAVPDAIFLIAGEERTLYGHELFYLQGKSFKQHVLAQAGDDLDPQRFHFLGIIPVADLKTLYQLSDVHFYLTVPHLISTSLLQAMASGCVIVGSATEPVKELIKNEQEGLLTDFYDIDGLARRALAILSDKETFAVLGQGARQRILDNHEQIACLKRLETYLSTFCDATRDALFASLGSQQQSGGFKA